MDSTLYLLPMARNVVTGQTVKTQDLTGARLTQNQMMLAEELARNLAEKMSTRTGVPWVGFVKPYIPSVRNID